MTRRQLARGAAGAVAGAGVVAGLAACENTTTPIGADAAGATGASAELVDPKPTGPGGLPLPRTDNSVTWAITDNNQPIPDAAESPAGPLRVYNYADYLAPATSSASRSSSRPSSRSRPTTRSDEAVAKLAAGAVNFDVIVGLTGSNIVDLIAQQAAAAAQPRVPAQPREERLGRRWRTRSTTAAARYTVPYVVWMDGIGWRNDKVREDIAGDGRPLGHLLARAGLPRQGRDPRRPARRAQHADAARRDARRETRPERQHRGRRPDQQGPEPSLPSSAPSATRRSRSPTTRRCPRPRPCCISRGQATSSAAAFYYMPKRRQRRTCCRSGGRSRTASCRTTSSASARRTDAARARARVHQLHARREERVRQLRQLHRLHAAPE